MNKDLGLSSLQSIIHGEKDIYLFSILEKTENTPPKKRDAVFFFFFLI